MPKDSKDSVIQLTSENNQLRIWSEKNTSVGDWNERMTAEQTLEFLDYQEVFSYYALLKSCHTIAECKKSWSQRNVKSKKNDWDRFVQLANKRRNISEENLNRMIRVWDSWSDLSGAVRQLYAKTNYLPVSKTALYEIATLNTSNINDERKLQDIIKFVDENVEIQVNDIRSIKKSAPSLKVINPPTSQSVPSYATKLKMPSSDEDLKKLKSKWGKIQKALDTINQEDVSLYIDYQTPNERLKELEQTKIKKEIGWTLKNFQKILNKWDVKNVEHVKDCKEKAKRGTGLSKGAIKRNQEVDEVYKLMKKHKLESECKKVIEHKKDFEKRKKENEMLVAKKSQSSKSSQSKKKSSKSKNVWD